MKIRLTVTMDPQVMHRAKRLARDRGASLSGVIEDLLTRELGDLAGERGGDAFSVRWGGKLSLQPRDEARYQQLAARYRL